MAVVLGQADGRDVLLLRRRRRQVGLPVQGDEGHVEVGTEPVVPRVHGPHPDAPQLDAHVVVQVGVAQANGNADAEKMT